MIKPVIYWQAPDSKNRIIKALQNNKVLITTTDTIPGFLANTTAQGFDALNIIKQDRQHKPYIILISDVSKLDYFVDTEQLTPQIEKLVNQFWPGQLTVIFQAKKEIPNFLKSEQGKIAIRCPKHPALLDILKHFNGLYSTSANKSSHSTPLTIDQVDKQVAAQVEYLVDDENSSENSQLHEPKPSTIIDVTNNAQIRVVRQGACSIQELEKVLGKTVIFEEKMEMLNQPFDKAQDMVQHDKKQ
jgi:L-threonylcarbamoyladenylate synthase